MRRLLCELGVLMVLHDPMLTGVDVHPGDWCFQLAIDTGLLLRMAQCVLSISHRWSGSSRHVEQAYSTCVIVVFLQRHHKSVSSLL